MSTQFGAALSRHFNLSREIVSWPEILQEFPEVKFGEAEESAEDFSLNGDLAPPSAPAANHPLSKKPRVSSLLSSPKLAAVTPAWRLEVRPAAELVASGIPHLDALTGGLPRGCLTEICGPESSGRTSLVQAGLAAATKRQEACALIDASDAFDPGTAAASGLDLSYLLWVRCAAAREDATQSFRRVAPSLEQVLRTADLLLQSSGFGLVAIDLGDIPAVAVRRIPLTTWFRFRRAVENTATVLMVITRQSCTKTCASLLLQLQGAARKNCKPAQLGESTSSHVQLLEGLSVRAEVLHSRLARKPVQPASTEFETRTAWAG
jgi:hypothetical protein